MGETIAPCRPKWESRMSDRERFVRQMSFQPVDRSFNMEFGYWDENFTLWSGFVENGITTNEEAHSFFNFDRIEVVTGNVWMSPPFEERVVSESDTKRILINEDGLYGEVPKDDHSTIPHFTRASIVTPEDWEREKEVRFDPDSPERSVDVAALKEEHPAGREYPLGVACGSMIGKVRDMLTFEGLAYATYDYPEMVEDMVERACVLVERFLDQVLPHFDFDFATGWEDICFNSGPIVSVGFFDRVVVPRYKRLRAKLEAHGITVWYTDTDGDVRPLLPGFLEGGINTLFPFEVRSCTHPGELLDRYRGELRIMGGVDKMKMISGREAIDAYLESLVPYVRRGGFIPFCDHRCPPDVTYENYLYYLDRKEELFGRIGGE